MEQNEELPYIEIRCKGEEDWLSNRGLGGSSASIVLDLNPYRNKRDLYDELTNPSTNKGFSNERTIYGHNAESPIRMLFRLHHPELEVIDPYDEEPVILKSKEHPFMTATLDGKLIDKESGRKGFYEGKTCHIMNYAQLLEWKDKIPQTYYCQVLHYFAVTKCDFCYLKAELIWERVENGVKKVKSEIREYYFTYEGCKEDIDILVSAEVDFMENYVNKGIRPRDSKSYFL